MKLKSKVKGFEGLCKPIWLNKNQVCHRLDNGITGFFKLIHKKFGIYFKIGKEFHGIIKDRIVYSTEKED